MKYKIIAICGEAGSGKDSLLQAVLKKNNQFHEIVSCTSRPPREKEKDGVNYFFLSEQEFLNKIARGEMIESTNFNNWFYGTSFDGLNKEKINIGVFNPAGLRLLKSNSKVDLLVFYVQASDKQRLIRQLNREDDPDVEEIIRRYHADKIDFQSIGVEAILLTNNTKEDFEICAERILNLGLMRFDSERYASEDKNS